MPAKTRLLLVTILCVAFAASHGRAAPPASKARAQEAEAIRSALEANFEACNHEDVKALVGTLSKSLPRVAEFTKEAKDTFEQTDAYFRLADFEVLEIKPPYAVARVVQITLPKDEKDRTAGTNQQIFFRNKSGLLPQWECVEYLQTFKKEGGKWKVHLILSEPKPAVWPPESKPAIRTDDMPAK